MRNVLRLPWHIAVSALCLGAFVLLYGCVSESKQSPGTAWDVQTDAGTQVTPDAATDVPLVFRPEESATYSDRNATTRGQWFAFKLKFFIGEDDVRQRLLNEDGDFRPGTYLEVAFPLSEYPAPRRFYMTTNDQWWELRRSGHSMWWVNAWPDMHVGVSNSLGPTIYVAFPEEHRVHAATRSYEHPRPLPPHPLGDDPLDVLSTIEVTVGNRAQGVEKSYRIAENGIEEAWDRSIQTYLRWGCSLRNQDSDTPEGSTCATH